MDADDWDDDAWEDEDGAYGRCECRRHAEIRPFPPLVQGGVSVKVAEWREGPITHTIWRTYVPPQEG